MEQTGVNGGKKAGDKSRMKQLKANYSSPKQNGLDVHFVLYILHVKTVIYIIFM
jgi:hypothetical protein